MLYRTLSKVASTNMRKKNTYVVTPRCAAAAAAAIVSAVVFRRPTKGYTHRYSMMHRRLTYCRYWGRASLPSTSIGTLYAPRYEEAFFLQEKNDLGRFAPSALPSCNITLDELDKRKRVSRPLVIHRVHTFRPGVSCWTFSAQKGFRRGRLPRESNNVSTKLCRRCWLPCTKVTSVGWWSIVEGKPWRNSTVRGFCWLRCRGRHGGQTPKKSSRPVPSSKSTLRGLPQQEEGMPTSVWSYGRSEYEIAVIPCCSPSWWRVTKCFGVVLSAVPWAFFFV